MITKSFLLAKKRRFFLLVSNDLGPVPLGGFSIRGGKLAKKLLSCNGLRGKDF